MLDQAPKPEFFIAAEAVLSFALVCLVRWVRRAKPQPDPWDKEVEEALQRDDAMPLCPRCLAPQESETWFCAECGCSIGPYNNWSPYLYLFSLGDLFRAGVSAPVRRSAFVVTGFLLLSLEEYAVFAPYYWYLFFRNLRRHPKTTEVPPPAPLA